MLASSEFIKEGQLLGKSVKGLNWKLAEVDERLVSNLVQKLDLSELLARILSSRGISDVSEAELFLEPRLRNLLPNPFLLKDMDKAASRIARAVSNKEKITVFGDYDVDGATSSALLKRFFRDLGLDSSIYIPNRLTEGYGPSVEAFKKIRDDGSSLVITVDCGIVSFEPVEYANSINLDTIILDHHLSIETIPSAHAVVNPNRFDDDFAVKSIAAVGVAYLTAIAVKSKLKEMGYFKNHKDIDMLQYLDLVALGTVCDVMSLVGINRAFVTQGLKLIGARKNLGLSVLSNVAKIDATPQSYHLGFVIGPRINAGGRVGEGNLGAELLSTLDSDRAFEIANRLEMLNNERRAIEATTLDIAIAQIESNALYDNPVIMVKGDNWHQGILGILASRIKEKYQKPAAVISFVGGVGKGSARSIPGIDFGSLIANAKSKDLVLQGGGHAMAGGFSVEESKIDKFYEFICENANESKDAFEKVKECYIDAIITAGAINGKLAKEINTAAPFGSGNIHPKIMLKEVVILSVRIVGKNHLLVIAGDGKNDRKVMQTVKCILFKGHENEVGHFITDHVGRVVDLIGQVQLNSMDDSKADFIIEDVLL